MGICLIVALYISTAEGYNKSMLNKVHVLSKNKFVQGGIIVTITSFLANILNYFFQSLLGHTLGSAGFGEIATLFSYVALISVPLSVITTIIIQKVSSSKNRVDYAHELESYFIHKLQKWWFLLLLPLLLTPFVPRLTNLSPLTAYFLIPFILISIISIFHTSALQGLALFLEFSVIGLIAAVIKLLGPFLVSLHIDGLLTVLICVLLSLLFSLIANLYIFREFVTKHGSSLAVKRIEKKLFVFFSSKQFIITLLSLLAIVALNNIDIILVKKLFTSSNTGLYASWSLFGKIIFYIVSPLASVTFVFFSGNNHKQNKKAMIVFFMGMVCITVGSFVGYQYTGSMFVPLFFGSQFSPVIPYLGLASLFGSLYTVIFFINNYFLAKVSKLALILPVSIPFYIIAIYFSRQSIQAIFYTDVWFVVGLSILYIGAYAVSVKREV